MHYKKLAYIKGYSFPTSVPEQGLLTILLPYAVQEYVQGR